MVAGMERRETYDLIGSDKVEGTAVYGPSEEQMGSIERVMINKRTGKVAFAVLEFGGFLGMGADHYPVPWDQLDYDTRLGGYRTNINRPQLEDAPKYSRAAEWDWSDETRGRRVYDYYGAPWA